MNFIKTCNNCDFPECGLVNMSEGPGLNIRDSLKSFYVICKWNIVLWRKSEIQEHINVFKMILFIKEGILPKKRDKRKNLKKRKKIVFFFKGRGYV